MIKITNRKYKIINTIIIVLLFAFPLFADVKHEAYHFVTAEGGIGYSALLNKSDLGSSTGLVGGKMQVGYEWNYRKLLIHTGLEFSILSDRTTANPFKLQTPYTQGLPAGLPMTQHFDFESYSISQTMGQLNIPIQVGAVFAKRYYFLAGARLGIPVLRSANTTASVRTFLTDPSLIGSLNDVEVHDAYTSTETASHSWATNYFNAQLSAEVGLVLNSFWEKPAPKGRPAPSNSRSKSKKKPILYRVALFADYGLNSSFKTGNPVELAQVAEPRSITMNDYYAASQSKVNSLLVGVKFAVLFQLNEHKPEKPLPSYFDIYIADSKTSQPIPASLTIYDKTRDKTTVRETSRGHLKFRAKDGEYKFEASNEQYYSASKNASISGQGVTETVRIALEPKPVPVVIDTPIIEIPIKVGAKVVLHNLFFATNQTTILPQSEKALSDLASFMTEHPGLTIRITGHTDDVGSDEFNQKLSEGRAKAVRTELVKRGVAATRIEADGKGESEPIASNATEEGRAKNRRVEFTITATGDELIEQVKEDE